MRSRSWTRRNHLTVLGILLCLLAAVFAVEAKLGWYSPDSAARVEFSSTKLRADDPPQAIMQVVSTPAPTPDFFPQVILLFAFALVAVTATSLSNPTEGQVDLAISPGTFPPLFLRPPPCV